MSAAYPEDSESDSAKEGTVAHDVCAKLLFAQGEKPELIGTVIDGVYVDEDMYRYAKMYADDILTVYRANPHTMIMVEQKVDISEYNWGTPDAYIWDEKKQFLHIWDFKYGFGNVEAVNNWQLINYIAGIIRKHNIQDLGVTVIARIVQPRCFTSSGPIKEWRVPLSDLRGPINQLANSAQQALSPKAQCASGSHCYYCTAIHACPTAIDAGMKLYELVGRALPQDMDLGRMYEVVLRAKEQIEALEAGMQQQLIGTIKKGLPVHGWGLIQGKGKRKWVSEANELFEMGDAMGINLRKPTEAVTPAQAEKLGLDKQIVATLTEAPLTALKLTKLEKVFL